MVWSRRESWQAGPFASVRALNLEAFAARLAALTGDRRVRIVSGVAGFALVTLLTGLIAHPKVFTSFSPHDG